MDYDSIILKIKSLFCTVEEKDLKSSLIARHRDPGIVQICLSNVLDDEERKDALRKMVAPGNFSIWSLYLQINNLH
jgi:hypothetical protein